jgi:amino-acid N-acetyltransferase
VRVAAEGGDARPNAVSDDGANRVRSVRVAPSEQNPRGARTDGPAYLPPDRLPGAVPDANVILRPADDALPYVESLLSRAGLPTADLRDPSVRLRVAVRDGDRVGAGGLEVCGESALLRSLVVDPAARGEGVGTAVCAALEAEARDAGARRTYLLTTTAAEFFAARGYERVARDEVPPAVAGTSEFETLCPDAAVAMRRSL